MVFLTYGNLINNESYLNLFFFSKWYKHKIEISWKAQSIEHHCPLNVADTKRNSCASFTTGIELAPERHTPYLNICAVIVLIQNMSVFRCCCVVGPNQSIFVYFTSIDYWAMCFTVFSGGNRARSFKL